MMKVILILSLVFVALISQGYCNSDSCKGRCGESYNPLNDCHCDSKCREYDNCCGDYKKLCGRKGLGLGLGSSATTSITDAEIKSVSEKLFSLDANRATASQLVIEPQEEISGSQTGSQNDLSSRPLFKHVDEGALFSKPTYKALLTLLDNYKRSTGQTEDVPSQETQEQDTFLRETMLNTAVGKELYNFLCSKGAYSSQNNFIQDLKMMWFGLYSRSNGQLDSSGFEHVFVGEIKGGKVSGFHNWLQFYRNEKQGLVDYYSHSFNGPWTTYPDVLGMQFEWDGYFKQVGSAFIGSSPEFDLAMYTLCYIARPGKMCYLSLGGKTQAIQTYTWDKSSYGDGKKYIASAYPATP